MVRFCVCNLGAYSFADVAYILVFAIVMLNMDVYNFFIDVVMKMSEGDFVFMVIVVEVIKDLDVEVVVVIYARVIVEEIKMYVAELSTVIKVNGGDNVWVKKMMV